MDINETVPGPCASTASGHEEASQVPAIAVEIPDISPSSLAAVRFHFSHALHNLHRDVIHFICVSTFLWMVNLLHS